MRVIQILPRALDTDHFIPAYWVETLGFPSDWNIVWTIEKERNRLEEQVSAGKLDPSKQFDFSEIYIFGKYENFVKRVSNINELLNTIQNFRAGWKSYI